MNSLESQGYSCAGCEGTCCTYQANSMLVTPVEALELFTYLKDNQLVTDDLKSRLEAAVKEYRLEPKYSKGSRSYLRKTYTCPFFKGSEFGCPLPREVKPFGCLAFNAHHETLKASEHCFSDTTKLEKREELHTEETQLNEEIRKKFQLFWEKSPIPNALLDFISADLKLS